MMEKPNYLCIAQPRKTIHSHSLHVIENEKGTEKHLISKNPLVYTAKRTIDDEFLTISEYIELL